MQIEAFIKSPGRLESASKPEVDALWERDALQEAQLLAVRVDLVRSTSTLLFDLRGALQLTNGNTGILQVRRVGDLSWSGGAPAPRTAWMVVSSVPLSSDDEWSLELGFVPDALLRMTGVAAEFFEGDVPGCDEPPPNYVLAEEAELVAGVQNWQSDFRPTSGTSLKAGIKEG